MTGTLKYVTGFTGFSGDPAEQEGNYIAFTVSADQGATVKARLNRAHHDDAWLTDADNEFLFRISDEDSQSISIRAEKDGKVETKTYLLSALTLESE